MFSGCVWFGGFVYLFGLVDSFICVVQIIQLFVCSLVYSTYLCLVWWIPFSCFSNYSVICVLFSLFHLFVFGLVDAIYLWLRLFSYLYVV